MSSSTAECEEGQTPFWCQDGSSSTDGYNYCSDNTLCPANVLQDNWSKSDQPGDAVDGNCCYCGACLTYQECPTPAAYDSAMNYIGDSSDNYYNYCNYMVTAECGEMCTDESLKSACADECSKHGHSTEEDTLTEEDTFDFTDHTSVEEAFKSGLLTAHSKMSSSTAECEEGQTPFWCQDGSSSTDGYNYCSDNTLCPANVLQDNWSKSDQPGDAVDGNCCYCGACLTYQECPTPAAYDSAMNYIGDSSDNYYNYCNYMVTAECGEMCKDESLKSACADECSKHGHSDQV